MLCSVRLNKDQVEKYKKCNKKYVDSFKRFIPKNFYNVVNKLNESSQATKSKNIGQMSEIVPEFLGEFPYGDHNDFEVYYNKKYPGRYAKCLKIFKDYSCKCFSEFLSRTLEECLNDEILNNYLDNWFYNFVIVSNFYGFAYHKICIEAVAKEKGLPYKISTSEQESKNIDAFIGTIPYSVKPLSWKHHSKMTGIKVDSEIRMIYYYFENKDLVIEYEN